MIDKSSHLITVSRDYLEMLEDIFEKYRDNKPRAFTRSVGPTPKRKRVLFAYEGQGVTADVDAVIVLDDDGKELGVFGKISKLDNLL